MSSITRKLKRKRLVADRKRFMKDFKKAMLKFKKQVKCSVCDYQPQEGEKIDDWHVNKKSEKIDLICTNCYHDEEAEKEEEHTDV